ncbi:MAG: D-TA family PLP-dependent enzyme [Pirellulales bacterium]|nr:D-TA family PLP-dependent enzyme [Pirellulales bacterium]
MADAPWYEISNVDEIASPTLLVYLDRVRQNVARMIEMAGGTRRLRPHVKTHKMAEVVSLQLDAGIDKFKCATIAEAEMLADCGARDVLLGYPIVGPNIARVARLAAKYPSVRFTVVADDADAVQALSAAVAATGRELDVLVDIDNGMHRSGIAPDERADALYRAIHAAPGLTVGGLHVYDGHLRDHDPAARTAAVDAAFVPVQAMIDRLERAGLRVPRVVAGGSPTFPMHARYPEREVSPGTCVFWDASYQTKFPDLGFIHAALVLTRVISRPASNIVCLDLGFKAVSPDNPDPRAELIGLSDAKMTVHSEEHLAVRTTLGANLKVGTPVYAIPYHICPTCALHREAIVVEQGIARDRWPIAARDRMLTI